MTITCEIVREKLLDDIQLREDDALCRLIRQHVADCAECQTFMDSLGKTIQCFKEYESTPPTDLHEAVLNRLRREGMDFR